MSALEDQLALHLRAERMPMPDREYKFVRDIVGDGPGIRERLKAANLKDWRFDFCWPRYLLAVEVQGGGWVNGKHNREEGMSEDYRKLAVALSHGWTVWYCTGSMVRSGEAAQRIKQLIEIKT